MIKVAYDDGIETKVKPALSAKVINHRYSVSCHEVRGSISLGSIEALLVAKYPTFSNRACASIGRQLL